MAWDVDEATGTIHVTPLVSYETATLLETGCGVRLVLASPDDRLGTGSIVVQMAMTVPQAQQLAEDLRNMVERLLGARPQSRPN